MKKGKPLGVGFGIRNIFDESIKFNYNVEYNSSSPVCGNLNKDNFESWIISNRKGISNIQSEEVYVDIIRFKIPEGVPEGCVVKYKFIVNSVEGEKDIYAEELLDVKTII